MNQDFELEPGNLIKVPIRTPGDLPPLKKRKSEFINTLEIFSMDFLRNLYKSLMGKLPVLKKAELIQMFAEKLIFATEKEFRQWIGFLPPLTQNVLFRLMFTDFVPVPILEKEFNKTFLIHEKHGSWRTVTRINEEHNLGFMVLDLCNGHFFLGLPRFLREALSFWFMPPPEADIANCVSEDTGHGWDNSEFIADSYPLLCDAVQQIFAGTPDAEKSKAARGFNKKQLVELRASSGFLDFDLDHAYCPDSIDLVLRFALCMKNFKPVLPDDAQDDIRNMVSGFFSEDTQYRKSWNPPDRNYLESNVCIDHLSRSPGYYMGNFDGLPPSRVVFHDILMKVAEDSRCFDAGKLAEHIKVTAQPFAFCGGEYESTLKIKASTLDLDGITYLCEQYEDFRAVGILRHQLLLKPLFKAYCYIFAALGLLEITQEIPPLALAKGKKQLPLSPYDSLKTIRITKFGLWCLGLSSEKPPKPSHEYQAIADRELLLVTVQGNSLERTVYLNRIGVKLGEDRWRVSPASFISGCETIKQIEDRIARFRKLIDPSPAPHWLELFDKVISRAGLFGRYRDDVFVYSLPEDKKITGELLRDPELRNVASRAEGGMLIVPAKNQKKFLALLTEHGIASF